MSFSIKRTTKERFDLEKIILERSGIKDKDLFLNPNSDNDTDPSFMTDFDKAIDILLNSINEKDKIGIMVDPDADGFTSSAIIYLFLQNFDLEIEPIFHIDKSHGLTDYIMREIEENDYDLVISPDGSTSDHKQQRKIIESGKKLIILDHHDWDREMLQMYDSTKFEDIRFHDNFALVSNKHPDYLGTNQELCGAGICLRFVEVLGEKLGIEIGIKYSNLATIGQVGDSTNISDPEIRNIVFKGIERIQLDFLRVALSDDNFSDKKITPRGLSFSIIPKINAVARIGSKEEREELFYAMVSNSAETYPVERRRKIDGEYKQVTFHWTKAELGHELAERVKNRQDRQRRDFMKDVRGSINNDYGVGVCAIMEMENLYKYRPLTGLVANMFANEHSKPFLVMFEKTDEDTEETYYIGSGRGLQEHDISNFRDWCNDCDAIEWASGHENAFGIKIMADKMDDFMEYVSKYEQPKLVYNVDMHLKQPSPELVEYAERNKHLIGGKIESLLFAYEGLEFDKTEVQRNGSMTILNNGLRFVLYGDNGELFEQVQEHEDPFVRLDIVGEPSMCNWVDPAIPEIVITNAKINDGTSILDEEGLTVDDLDF